MPRVDMVESEVRFHSRLKQAEAELRKRMSKPGKLGLPKLLDAKRLKYGIPDEAFTKQTASFDRIFISQVPEDEEEDNSLVVKPDTVADRHLKEAPRGVIVSAGLLALDEIRSHGIDVGHTVFFMRNYPFRIIYTHIDRVPMSLLVLRAGDICGTLDLSTELASGKISYAAVRGEDDSYHHVFKDAQGRVWNPAEPYVLDEM